MSFSHVLLPPDDARGQYRVVFVCEMGNKNPGATLSAVPVPVQRLHHLSDANILQIVFSYYLDPIISSGNTKSASFSNTWYPSDKNLQEVELSITNKLCECFFQGILSHP